MQARTGAMVSKVIISMGCSKAGTGSSVPRGRVSVEKAWHTAVFLNWVPLTRQKTNHLASCSHTAHIWRYGNNFFPRCSLPAAVGLGAWEGIKRLRVPDGACSAHVPGSGVAVPPQTQRPGALLTYFLWLGAKHHNSFQSIKEDLLWGWLLKPRNITLLGGEG